jgi:hypothetical protein
MILLTITIALIAGITYYHYLQGGFTATISAVCAFLAVLLAFGYYEQAMGLFPPGKMADYAAGMLLIAIYGVSYIVLRVIFDALVPGNIRLPLWVDRGCAVGFGLVAAVLGVGTFVVGAQLLPFGASIGMHANFAIHDRSVVVPRTAVANARSDQDSFIYNQLKEDTLPTGGGSTLTVDSLVLQIASTASGGAFSGDVKFANANPDLLTTAFANRLGADTGCRRVIINNASAPMVRLDDKGVMSLSANAVSAADAEIKALRPNETSLTLPKDSSKQLLVVRLRFDDLTADSDGYVRMTPAASPLLVGGQIIYPVGAMTRNGTIALFRIDDQMIISMKEQNRKVDLVYAVPADLIAQHAPNGTFAKGSAYVQAKLFGRVDISGQPLETAWTPSTESTVLTKKASPLVTPPASPAPAAAPEG